MMAARFRSVFWVAVASIAGLCCYMITQYVAGERLALAKLERQVRNGRIVLRGLETELGTRGSMAQLEAWNSQALALAAPRQDQFVKGDQLAMLGRPAAPVPAAIAGEGVAQVAYRAPAPAAAASVRPAAQPAPVQAEPAPAEPIFRQATYVRPARDRVAETARPAALLASSTLADIGRIASTERPRSVGEGQ